MRNLGLQAAQPRAKARTTVPAQDLDERPDLLRRDFTADEPGKKLCGDIPPQAGGAPSYIRTWTGFVYLATVLDCCTKKVAGYAMADHMRTSLVCQAIDMAVKRCPIKKGVTIFHSDRGNQYTSQKFLDHLKSYGIRPSVGRTGVCWDNAWASVVQRHAQERESPPNGVSHEGQSDQGHCLMDRAEIQSCPPSLSPRVSHSRRGRKRFPGPKEDSLKHKQALSEKHPTVQRAPPAPQAQQPALSVPVTQPTRPPKPPPQQRRRVSLWTSPQTMATVATSKAVTPKATAEHTCTTTTKREDWKNNLMTLTLMESQ